MCVDAQIPNRGAEFFCVLVAETPTLDALRILYVFHSFSRSYGMNSAYIRRSPGLGMCVDAQIPDVQIYSHFRDQVLSIIAFLRI